MLGWREVSDFLNRIDDIANDGDRVKELIAVSIHGSLQG
jgi:hypothetical protein